MKIDMERHRKMIEAKLLRKKLKNGLIVDKWDLVNLIEQQEKEIKLLKAECKQHRENALKRFNDWKLTREYCS